MLRKLSVSMVIFLALVTGVWAAEPVLIGAYLPMTGLVAAYGQMGWDGITVKKLMTGRPPISSRPACSG